MAQERTSQETAFPPYFDRFIEERDRRLIAELGRLETRIQHNAQRIDELRQEMERRFTEARDDRQTVREEMERRFTEAKADRQTVREEMERRFTEVERRFTEASDDRRAIRSEISRLDTKIDSYFRWSIGLMVPIVLGILAIIIRVFFLGPIP